MEMGMMDGLVSSSGVTVAEGDAWNVRKLGSFCMFVMILSPMAAGGVDSGGANAVIVEGRSRIIVSCVREGDVTEGEGALSMRKRCFSVGRRAAGGELGRGGSGPSGGGNGGEVDLVNPGTTKKLVDGVGVGVSAWLKDLVMCSIGLK
jgi:hypothetical protein